MNRPWHELIHDEDAIELVRAWAEAAPHPVELLPRREQAGRRALAALQVTTRSPLGAVAYHTGGLLVDRGFLRVLGAGGPRLPRAIDEWNGPGGFTRCVHGPLVADDVVGGFFAWFAEPQTIHYFAPDTLAWEDTELGYSDWLQTMLGDGFAGFYRELRWAGWEQEVAGLGADHTFSWLPPLVAQGPPLSERSRASVPVEQAWSFNQELGQKLRDLPDGATFQIDWIE
ncbi:MAG: DUF2625 family protein [Planctomycetota bacterium]